MNTSPRGPLYLMASRNGGMIHAKLSRNMISPKAKSIANQIPAKSPFSFRSPSDGKNGNPILFLEKYILQEDTRKSGPRLESFTHGSSG